MALSAVVVVQLDGSDLDFVALIFSVVDLSLVGEVFGLLFGETFAVPLDQVLDLREGVADMDALALV